MKIIKHRMKSFSLIEFLIVIMVILILLSLLQPSLVRALKQAKLVLCINHMKQNGLIMDAYADDHKGYVWDSDWHHGYGFSILRFKHGPDGPIPEGDYSKNNEPWDMRKYILEYSQSSSHNDYVDSVMDSVIDLPTWACPEVDAPSIDDPGNTRFAAYYNYYYFPGSRYPFLDYPEDENGLVDKSLTNMPRRLGDLAEFVVQQDHVSIWRGQYHYNHGPDIIEDYNFVTMQGKNGKANPSASWRTGGLPDGAVASKGDGSVKWHDFTELSDVGRAHAGGGWSVLSLLPGE